MYLMFGQFHIFKILHFIRTINADVELKMFGFLRCVFSRGDMKIPDSHVFFQCLNALNFTLVTYHFEAYAIVVGTKKDIKYKVGLTFKTN